MLQVVEFIIYEHILRPFSPAKVKEKRSFPKRFGALSPLVSTMNIFSLFEKRTHARPDISINPEFDFIGYPFSSSPPTPEQAPLQTLSASTQQSKTLLSSQTFSTPNLFFRIFHSSFVAFPSHFKFLYGNSPNATPSAAA